MFPKQRLYIAKSEPFIASEKDFAFFHSHPPRTLSSKKVRRRKKNNQGLPYSLPHEVDDNTLDAAQRDKTVSDFFFHARFLAIIPW